MSDKKSLRLKGIEFLSVILPFLLIAPNIGLVYSDDMGFMPSVLNLLVPLTFYMVIMSLWKRTGITTLLLIPMMCFAGFQIVLIYLYGGSIIGVDMFLNVVTTNMTEVNELLGNLLIAIGLILVLYIPPIVYSIICIARKKVLDSGFRKKYFRFSIVSFCILLIVTGLTSAFSRYSVGESLFPVNIFENLYLAFKRTSELNNYSETSAAFSYDVKPVSDNSREIYVVVVGETGRAANWQLGGYERETNPGLSGLENVYYFPYSLSESNTTHKSVPMMISPLKSADFAEINNIKSGITLFKNAGFKTSFFSNQQRNRSYTEYFSNEADTTVYLSDLNVGQYDGSLVDMVKSALADTIARKQLIVLHTYGSHFKYNDRYPAGFGSFKPDNFADANAGSREKLINAFDNTILYADSCLSEIARAVNIPGVKSAMIYATDHGEDIFDDDRSRFLHASIVPTYYQLHVPMLVYVSDYYKESNPEKVAQLDYNRQKQVSSTASFFNTLVDLSGIETGFVDKTKSLASEDYKEPERVFLTDRNEQIKLIDAGLKKEDYQKFKEYRIRIE